MAAAPLGESLRIARRQAFVGRQAERELFASAFDEGADWAVLWLYGPGGVGKSALVAQLEVDAAELGAEVTTVDGRALVQSRSPGDVLADVLLSAPSAPHRARVVLIDAFEQLTPLEARLRNELLAMLPPDVRVVVAGRHPPADPWRADPAWRDRLRIVGVRNLSPDDADRYLERAGLAAESRPPLIEASHGHPLALALFADLAARDELRSAELATGLGASPDTVRALLGHIIDDVPSESHRRLLEVAAVARVTTESLIRDALPAERDHARELFEWLRSRSYMETGTDGVQPHDLVRDALDADLRWRDPDAYADVFRPIRRHIHHRLEHLRGAAQRRAIADEKFVFRNLPSVLSPVDWSSWGATDPEPAGPSDRDAVIGLIERHEGPESAAIAAWWWNIQPEAFHVLHADDRSVQGVVALVVLSDAPENLAPDPVARAAMSFAARAAPPRPGETVTQTRFVLDRDRYQAPSPTLNAVPILTLQRYLQQPNLSWDFLTLFEPDAMNDYFAIADLPRVEGADTVVGARRYGLFAHDFRRVPVQAWLEGVTDRALAQDPAPAGPAPVELVVLSHETFTTTVRQALRDLGRADRLATNPLTHSRWVHDQQLPGEDAVATLARALRAAVDALAANHRDEKRHRALVRTYLEPAPSQERAAEVLGLPFSTYRRHLTEGVDAVVTRLWELELHGPPGR